MRLSGIFALIIVVFFSSCNGEKPIVPDLNIASDAAEWTVFNREVDVDEGVVHLDAKAGSGFIKLNNFIMGDGTVELDIKGKDLQGQSFVGLAFHGLNDSVYDAIYFRPFNFKNEERNTHSVQYIAHPKYTWYYLREQHPGKYENKLVYVPDPNDWFHVKIEIGAVTSQISIHVWVGHGSEGWFRNLEINPAETITAL